MCKLDSTHISGNSGNKEKFQACSFFMTFSLIWSFSRNNWSVKFWSAFLMDLERQLVANINFLKENIRNYDTLKI